MDARQFDALAQTLSAAASRRRVLLSLARGALAALQLGPLALDEAEQGHAKRRKKRRKKRKKKFNPCVPQCAATNPCGPDGCGGDCGPCDPGGGGICQEGVCTCTQDVCNGQCVLACEPDEVRPAPLCSCCKPNGAGCTFGRECCSFIADGASNGGCISSAGSPFLCRGRTEGTGCHADAQCESGNCRDSGIGVGTCA
jgi:hypothetical protein